MKLQRLTYPFREESISQKIFGASSGKFACLRDFFTCAAIDSPPMNAGTLQSILDSTHEHRKLVIGQRLDTGNGSPDLFLLGKKDKLPAFSEQILKLYKTIETQGGENPTCYRAAETLLLDFLKTSQNSLDTPKEALDNTMGWLDVDSGCFAMKSMTALNDVRRLFGIQPHVAMRKQKNNYGDNYKDFAV